MIAVFGYFIEEGFIFCVYNFIAGTNVRSFMSMDFRKVVVKIVRKGSNIFENPEVGNYGHGVFDYIGINVRNNGDVANLVGLVEILIRDICRTVSIIYFVNNKLDFNGHCD